MKTYHKEKTDTFAYLENSAATAPETGCDKIRFAAILYQNLRKANDRKALLISFPLKKI